MVSIYRGDKAKDDIAIAIGIPSRGPVHLRWMMHNDKLKNFLPPGCEWCYIYTIGKEIAEARQTIAEQAVKRNAKYLFFLDDDVFPPHNIIAKLMSENKDVITGVYWGKAEPSFPVLFEKIGAGPWLDFPPEKVVQVGGAGLGCCLVRTDVFRKLKEKGESVWFKTDWLRDKGDGSFSRVSVGEDHYFYDLCHKHGIEVWADTSVLCDHYDMLHDKFFPGEDRVKQYCKKQMTDEQRKDVEEKEKIIEKMDKKVYNKLNLGCGNKYLADEGWCNIDHSSAVKCDMRIDLETARLPFEDNSIEEVRLYDVIEHVHNFLPLMEELYRVCKNGAKVDIVCPYWTSKYAWCDPTHIRAMNEVMFYFFDKAWRENEYKNNTAASPFSLKSDFKVDNLIFFANENYKDKDKKELSLLNEKYNNVIDRFRIVLKANKEEKKNGA